LSPAKVAVEPLRAIAKTAFLLMRSGLLTEEQLQKSVADLTFKKQPARKHPDKKLSDIIHMFLDEKSPNLKKRTLRDYEVIFAKIISIIGNKELKAYSRQDVIHLRSTLLSEGLKERSCNKHLVLVW
jgi:hypothetical protein